MTDTIRCHDSVASKNRFIGFTDVQKFSILTDDDLVVFGGHELQLFRLVVLFEVPRVGDGRVWIGRRRYVEAERFTDKSHGTLWLAGQQSTNCNTSDEHSPINQLALQRKDCSPIRFRKETGGHERMPYRIQCQ